MFFKPLLLGCAALFACPLGLLAAAPDADALGLPERWNRNASGKMTISRDDAEKAVRFDIDFAEAKDPWFYPFFQLKEGESLDGMKMMRFEMKANATEGEPGVKFGCAMITGQGGREFKPILRPNLPTLTGEWQTVILPLTSTAVNDPAAIRLIRIGANPKATGGKWSMMIRNIEFLDAAAANALNAETLTAALNDANNWKVNSSGKMTISQADNALVFDADFSTAKDPWLYPVFPLKNLTLAGVAALEFEVRLLPANTPVKLALLMLNRPNPNFKPAAWFNYTKPTGEWQKVTIELTNPEKGTATSMNLGVNPSGAEKVSFAVRNLKAVPEL